MRRPGIIALTVAVAMGFATASFAQSGGALGLLAEPVVQVLERVLE